MSDQIRRNLLEIPCCIFLIPNLVCRKRGGQTSSTQLPELWRPNCSCGVIYGHHCSAIIITAVTHGCLIFEIITVEIPYVQERWARMLPSGCCGKRWRFGFKHYQYLRLQSSLLHRILGYLLRLRYLSRYTPLSLGRSLPSCAAADLNLTALSSLLTSDDNNQPAPNSKAASFPRRIDRSHQPDLAGPPRMWASGWIWATAFLASTALSTETVPFVPATDVETSKRAFEVLQILKRSSNCPNGYNPCSRLGDANACCRDGTNCSRDAANNIACCPTGASCTGTLTSETTGAGTSFMFPQTTAATTTSEAGAGVITGSTISGAYPFIYVPTTFSNPAICSSYFSLCQSEYTQCTVAVMGRYGVTVGGPGGAGTTVEAVTATSEATSICSSLSVSACHRLELGYCGTVETQSANANANGIAAAPGRTSSLYDLALGLAVGVGGLFI